MTKLRTFVIAAVVFASVVICTAFKEKPKSHLIVGLWQITEANTFTLTDRNKFVGQLYFGSDELTSIVSFTANDGTYLNDDLRLAYRIYEHKEEYNKPVVYLISTCDKELRLAFSIEKLTKDSLQLKCLREVINEEFLPNVELLTFERIAGPAENMAIPKNGAEKEGREREKK